MNILSDNFYRALFEQSNIPLSILKADAPRFTIVATNQQYNRSVNKTPEQLIGNGAFEVFDTTNGENARDEFVLLMKSLIQCIESREEVKLPVLHFKMPAADDQPEISSYWQIEISPIRNDHGIVEYLMCGTHNVTHRELLRIEAEEARRREEELHEELAAANEELTAVNEELSITNEEMAATNEELITVTEELSLSQDSLKQLNLELESRIMRRTVSLAESEERLRSIFAQAPLGICVLKGPELIIELANNIILAIWGKTKDVIGKPHSMVRPEMEKQSLAEVLQQVYISGNPYTGNEVRMHISKSGQKYSGYYNFVYQPLFDNAHNVTGIMIIVEDVTEKVEAKQARIRKDEQIQLAKEAAQLGMFDMDMQQGTMEWDARCRELFGITHNNPVSYKDDFLPGLYPEDRERVSRIINNVFNKALTNGEYDVEYRTIGAEDGLLRWVRAKGRTFFDENDKPMRFIGSVLDITEQVNNRQAILENEKRFRFLLNAIPQQVWTARTDGSLDYVNQTIINDFGRHGKEIVALGWQAFVHPEDLPHSLEAWKTSLSSGKNYMVEFRLRFKDDTYHWHLARAIPLVEDGEIKLWVGTNTDIDFQKSNEHRKDEFLSIASHELKTPLTSIKAFNQLMQRAKDPERITGFIYKSAEHITRLERLINDLLDVTKINAGKLVYDMQPFSFGQMLQESVESVQHISPSHQIIIEEPADVILTGDRLRLEQVVNNFLTNAIKYSPQANQVIVRSKTEGNNLVVAVQDFGIGIAEESLDRLFDRYYRVDNTAMRFEGLGLGLFISSEILKRHMGSFWIESEIGKGSTFYFRLPLNLDATPKPAIRNEGFYQDDNITIICYDHQYLSANWTGFQNFDSVKQGCMYMLDMIIKHNCTKILNDNRQVLGTWSEASDWVGTVFFPMMEKAGITQLAWVFSPSVFSQLSAKKSVNVAVGSITTQFFTDVQLAAEWLDKGTSI